MVLPNKLVVAIFNSSDEVYTIKNNKLVFQNNCHINNDKIEIRKNGFAIQVKEEI